MCGTRTRMRHRDSARKRMRFLETMNCSGRRYCPIRLRRVLRAEQRSASLFGSRLSAALGYEIDRAAAQRDADLLTRHVVLLVFNRRRPRPSRTLAFAAYPTRVRRNRPRRRKRGRASIEGICERDENLHARHNCIPASRENR